MSAVQNVFRRGAAYWWRRTLKVANGRARPTTLCMSLGTRDLAVARRRGAAMTTRSEELRMNLYERAARDGLTSAQCDAVFRGEMRDYRRALVQLQSEWAINPQYQAVTDVDRDMAIFEATWSAFAKTGVIDGAPTPKYSVEQWPELDHDQRSAVRRLLAANRIRASLETETAARLAGLNITASPVTIATASKLVLQARTQAVRDHRVGLPLVQDDTVPQKGCDTPTAETLPAVATAAEPAIPRDELDSSHIPEAWRSLTFNDLAELYITRTPGMFDHRREGKRAAEQVGEHTLRQIRWAARLLDKSMNPPGSGQPVRPFWACTFEDIKTLDKWFDRLPTTCGKSPHDRLPATTFEEICERAISRIDDGELEADAIGFHSTTSNKHLCKLNQLW